MSEPQPVPPPGAAWDWTAEDTCEWTEEDERTAEEGFLASLPPLVRAAATGDVAEVRALLRAGAAPTEAAADGWSALHAAATRGHVEVVRELLAAGAPVDLRRPDGMTPLLNGAGRGGSACVEVLLRAGADPNATEPRFGWTPLSRAAECADAASVRLLLDAGADPDAGTPIVDAAEAGSLECVRLLLEAGAGPGVRVEGRTVAELARRHGHEEVAAVLDAWPSSPDRGRTP